MANIDTLISDARSYVASTIEDADLALYNAQLAAMQVGYDDPEFTPVTLPDTPPSAIDYTLPTFDTITLELPSEPTDTLLFQDISDIELGTVPTLTAVAPTITLPNTPNQLPDFTQVAPTINTSFAFPEPPSELTNPLITEPTLTERTEPTKPQVLLPGFTAVAPTDTTTAPDDLEGDFDAAYRNAAPSTIAMVDGYVDAMMAKYNPRYAEQMAAIETQLATYMAGGTGLNTAVENQIYERARDKNNSEANRQQAALWADAAARGHTRPPGSLLAASQKARQDAADLNAAAAREIVVMQAEMEQKNLQFAVTQSANLRQTMLSASLSYMQNLVSINGQALDYAKSILGAVIESYNTAVKAYGLKLDAYRAEAAVFETRLKSSLAGIELYKVEIDALQALTQVDKTKVDVYRARIDTLTVYANVYRAQIEAVQGRASLEKLKLELFKTQTEAYGTQVQAKNAEWNGYRAAIDGQQAKAQIFNTQVQGFNAQLTGYKTQIEAQSEVVKAQAMTNDARAKQYSAVLSGYKTVVEARGDVARTKLENQRQHVITFQAGIQAQVSNAKVASEYYRATSTVGIKNAELSQSSIFKGADIKRDYLKTVTDLNTNNARIHSSLAAASMSGMNTLAAQTAAT